MKRTAFLAASLVQVGRPAHGTKLKSPRSWEAGFSETKAPDVMC